MTYAGPGFRSDRGAPHFLVTGGAGFIGSHLAEAMLARDYRVTVIDNLSTGRLENISHLMDHSRFSYAVVFVRFQIILDDITNEVVMDRLVSECDIIIHLAAAVGVELIVRDAVNTIETNVLGAHSVLRVANRYRRKVVLASSSEIYGKNGHIPFREDDDRILGPTTKARWSYSTSKAVDEFLGLAYHAQKGLPVVVVRLFNTIGPRQSGHYGMVVPRFVEQALKGEPLTVYDDGQQTRCFGDVRDVVQAIVGLAECSEADGQIFNVGNTSEITILELAKEVLKLVDSLHPGPTAGAQAEERILFVPYEQAYEHGFEDMRRRVPDITKVGEYIGWSPQRTLEETLKEIIHWYISEGVVAA